MFSRLRRAWDRFLTALERATNALERFADEFDHDPADVEPVDVDDEEDAEPRTRSNGRPRRVRG